MKENNKKLIGFLGIGVFGFLAVNSFMYLVETILRNVNFMLSIDPIINYWTIEFFSLLIFLAIFFVLINKVSNSKEVVEKHIICILYASIGVYFATQIAQFLYTFYGSEYIIDNHMENFTAFYDYLRGNSSLELYTALIVYLKYLILGVFMYRKSNT